jgi:hypothetical protein
MDAEQAAAGPVGERVEQAALAVGLRQGECHEDRRQRDGEDLQPQPGTRDVALVGLDGGADPHPVNRHEDHQRPEQPRPGMILFEQGRDLCDGEHEDEVEEQLRPADPSLFALPPFAGVLWVRRGGRIVHRAQSAVER